MRGRVGPETHREVAAPVHAALRRDLEALRVRPHPLDDADDLGAGLHHDLAAAMTAADEVLRVRLLVEVHHEEVAAWQATRGWG